MKGYTVCLTAKAEHDIRHIRHYTAHQLLVETTAREMTTKIKAALKSLEQLPYAHPAVNDDLLFVRGYRKLIIGNYVALYIVDDESQTVNVIRILSMRQDWKSLL